MNDHTDPRTERTQRAGLDADHTDPRTERTQRAGLDAAEELFEEQGVDGVTHANVAAAARLSRTTVYRHWPTRQDLLLATLERVGRPVLSEPTGDVRADLTRLLTELSEHLADDHRAKMFASVIERARWDPVVAEVKSQIGSQAMSKLTAIIRRGMESGELRSEVDVELAVSGLAGSLFLRRFVEELPIGPEIVGRLVEGFFEDHRVR